MSRIRSKDTTPEKIVRSILHRAGYRFRLHVRIPVSLARSIGNTAPIAHPLGRAVGREVKGSRTPRAISADIVLPKYKTAIFVHGCFWHRHKGCRNCTTPTNRRAWWLAKLNGNAARDKLHQAALRKLGWRVIVIWECETGNPTFPKRLAAALATRTGRVQLMASTSRMGRVAGGGRAIP